MKLAAQSAQFRKEKRHALLICFCPFVVIYILAAVFSNYVNGAPWIFWSVATLGLTGVPAASLYWLVKLNEFPTEYLGWRRSSPPYTRTHLAIDSIGVFFVIRLLLFAVGPFLFRFLHQYEISTAVEGIARVQSNGLAWLIVSIWWSIIPAFVEEVYFRGLLRSLFETFGEFPYNTQAYIATSGFLFGLGHIPYGITHAIVMSMVGGALAYIFLRIRIIWPLVFAQLGRQSCA